MTLRPRKLLTDRQTGAALVAVLFLIALLTALASSVLQASIRRGQLLRSSYDIVQMDEIADSAIRLTLIELDTASSAAVAGASLRARRYEIFGREVSASCDYEAGRIDLNAADERLLTAIFAANGLEESQARSIAQRIIDWRDPDDEPEATGAERQQYRAAHRGDGPRNAPFETITEIEQVLGLPALSDELLDAFTIYSQSPTVREDAATSAVQRALQWLRAAQSHAVIESEPGTPRTGRSNEETVIGKAIRVRACVDWRESKRCRVAIVRLTGDRARPVLVYAWYGMPVP